MRLAPSYPNVLLSVIDQVRIALKQKPQSKTCPPSVGFLSCIVGLALALVGLLSKDDSEFPSGRAPVITMGGVFFLLGLQIIRVTVFRQSAVGWATSAIGSLGCSLFSAALLWTALDKRTVYLDELGRPSPNQTTGHVVFLYIGVVLACFAVYAGFKAISQWRKKKTSGTGKPGDPE